MSWPTWVTWFVLIYVVAFAAVIILGLGRSTVFMGFVVAAVALGVTDFCVAYWKRERKP